MGLTPGPISFDNAPPAFDLAVNNLRDAFYHAISLDLGIVYPNQIFGSPAVFNATIGEQDWPHCNTNAARMLIGKLGRVDLSNLTSVPITLYLASEYKRKPLGQAIAAVFVSAFSMLSAIWAVFNLVMSFVFTSRSKHGQYHVFRRAMAFINIIAQQIIALALPARANMFNMIPFQRRMIYMERVFGQEGR